MAAEGARQGVECPSEGSDRERRRHALLRMLYEKDLGFVREALRRLGVVARERDDLAHEIFLRVYARLDDYDASLPSRPWLLAFVCRCAADWRRLARHRIDLGGVEPDACSCSQGPHDTFIRAETCEFVRKALEAIPAQRRAVLVLHDLEGWPMREVAARLGIRLFTSYSRLRLARAEFACAARRSMARG